LQFFSAHAINHWVRHSNTATVATDTGDKRNNISVAQQHINTRHKLLQLLLKLVAAQQSWPGWVAALSAPCIFKTWQWRMHYFAIGREVNSQFPSQSWTEFYRRKHFVCLF